MKLIQTNDYLLLIDEETEIKGGDWFYNSFIEYIKKAEAADLDGTIHANNTFGRKIVSYYPLTKEAKELDLPLLPNPFYIIKNNVDKELSYIHDSRRSRDFDIGFRTGYVVAHSNSKQFSLDDMRRAFERGYYIREENENDFPILERENFIESLSIQQLPKEFIPEYNLMNKGYDKPEDYPYHECKVLKTITNSEGKKVLVGTYK